MADMPQTPLVWTTLGNVPIDSLRYETAWEDTPAYTKFVERYRDASGQVVKESAHVFDRLGVSGLGAAATI